MNITTDFSESQELSFNGRFLVNLARQFSDDCTLLPELAMGNRGDFTILSIRIPRRTQAVRGVFLKNIDYVPTLHASVTSVQRPKPRVTTIVSKVRDHLATFFVPMKVSVVPGSL